MNSIWRPPFRSAPLHVPIKQLFLDNINFGLEGAEVEANAGQESPSNSGEDGEEEDDENGVHGAGKV